MKKEHIAVLLFIIFIALGSLTFRKVHIPNDASKCLIAKGKVARIYEGGIKDIVFKLEGDKTSYYINRGLEQGLDLEELQKELIGNQVTIRYPKHWTLLDPNNTTKHICILEYNNKQLFNEIKLVHG